MKRVDFVKYLIKQDCVFVRECGRHSVFFNPLTRRSSTVPRHNEIHTFLIKKISDDLGIVRPTKK